MRKTSFRAGILASAMAAGGLLAATPTLAQSYGYDRSYGYDQPYSQQAYCESDRQQRQAAGATFGAVIGAVAGSQMGARGRRTEGSVLGGVVGAMIGAGVGGGSADCAPARDPRRAWPSDGYGNGYGYDNRAYDSRSYDSRAYDRSYGYSDNRYGYGDRGYSDRRYDDRGYDDRRYDTRTRGEDCRLSESVIRLPDGRQEVRYVRACRDAWDHILKDRSAPLSVDDVEGRRRRSNPPAASPQFIPSLFRRALSPTADIRHCRRRR